MCILSVCLRVVFLQQKIQRLGSLFKSIISIPTISLLIWGVLFGTTVKASNDTIPDLGDRYQRAQVLMGAFQYEAALRELGECYHWDDTNIDYLLKIAYCHQQLGRYGDAKLFYNSALKQDSLNATALASLGVIYERETNYRQAVDYYDQLLAIDSTNSYYFKRRGMLALRMGDPINGTVFLLSAHRLNTRDVEIIDQLVDIYLAMDQLEYAENMLNKGFNLAPSNLKLLYNKARLFNKRKDYPAVISAVEAAMMQRDTSDYYQMMLGLAYLREDSLNQAIDHLEAIVFRQKATEHTHHYLGLAYLEKEDYKRGEANLRLAIDLGISDKVGTYYGNLGSIMAKQQEYKAAIDQYLAAYEYDPQPEYLFQLARNCDLYYQDKAIALRHYQRYLNTGHEQFREYTTKRITQLREIIHFQN